MSSTYVFAAEDDWVPVFKSVESSMAVRYVAAGVFDVNQLTTFARGADLPHLGRALARATVECPSYLATASPDTVRSEAVTASDGVTRYYVTQGYNSLTVEVCLGGQWQEGVLIAGRIATISDAAESQALYQQFGRSLRRHFVRVRAFLVGRAAHRRLLSGWRLTVAAHSPMAYDLAPE